MPNVQPAQWAGLYSGAMKLPGLAAALAAALIASATPSAQTPASAPQSPPQTLQQQNEEILRELRAIRMLLERLTTPPQAQGASQPATARITNLAGYALGKPDAPLTMVEFTDLQCPFCRHFMLTSFDEIKKNWIDTGKLR